MQVQTVTIKINTEGHTDIIDVTPQVQETLEKSGLQEGHLTVFISGSTAGVTTVEYEPGLLKDIPEALEKIAPTSKRYHHDATWGDGNGYAHVRASMVGASFTVPFVNGRMLLGTWQQIIVLDFDNRSRSRNVVVQLMGE
ncbi:YjbQ family protein [bacterium]|nr:YjbQ family protein [bacterium]RQV97075.1 MAG: YjbQ family protein [bacterium]